MKIAFIAHSTLLAGPLHNIEAYYLSKKYTVVKITHPLDEYESRSTEVSVDSHIKGSIPRKPLGFLNYLIDLILSIRLLMKYRPDSIVGCDNFDSVAGILYKKLTGKKKTPIMYFASDFAPKRFSNAILNILYTWIEKIALTSSDWVISNTKRAENERLKLGLSLKKSKVIPNCLMEKPEKQNKKYVKNDFLYIGSLTKEHGLFEFVRKSHTLMRSLLIIGDGYEKEVIRSFLKTTSVRFTILDHMDRSELQGYLASFQGFGLAPYSTSPWTTYCSPMKVIEYLAFGIPVIMSDVPEISEEVSRNSVGIVYNGLHISSIEREIEKFRFTEFSDRAYLVAKRYYFKDLYKQLPI